MTIKAEEKAMENEGLDTRTIPESEKYPENYAYLNSLMSKGGGDSEKLTERVENLENNAYIQG